MSVIGKVTLPNSTNNLIASTCYGTCPTASATVAKVATIQDSQAFTLMTGITVYIKFTNANTADAPTLNVNGTGAKAIKKYGTTAIGKTVSTSWGAGAVVSFTYDGTYWQHNDHIDNTNTNTWRNITVDGTAWKGTGTSTGALNFVKGTGTDITSSGNNLTIGADTNTITFNISNMSSSSKFSDESGGVGHRIGNNINVVFNLIMSSGSIPTSCGSCNISNSLNTSEGLPFLETSNNGEYITLTCNENGVLFIATLSYSSATTCKMNFYNMNGGASYSSIMPHPVTFCGSYACHGA